MTVIHQGGVMVFVILLLASAIALVWKMKWPSPEISNVLLRIRSWWLIAIVLFVSVSAGPFLLAVLFTGLSVFAVSEFCRLTLGESPTSKRVIFLSLSAALAAPAIVFALASTPTYGVPVFLALFAISWIALLANSTGGGVAFISLALSAVANLSLAAGSDVQTAKAAFFLLFVTGSNDVFQYLSGKTFGGPKLAPKISPAKTISGFLGGVVGSMALSYLLAPSFLTIGSGGALALGALMSLGGTAGDLTVSVLKRRASVANTGSLLPGHGGLLDRVDSLCVTAPLFFAVIFFAPRFVTQMKGLL